MRLPRLQIQIPALILPSSRNKDDKNDESSNANNDDPEEYNDISEIVDTNNIIDSIQHSFFY